MLHHSADIGKASLLRPSSGATTIPTGSGSIGCLNAWVSARSDAWNVLTQLAEA